VAARGEQGSRRGRCVEQGDGPRIASNLLNEIGRRMLATAERGGSGTILPGLQVRQGRERRQGQHLREKRAGSADGSRRTLTVKLGIDARSQSDDKPDHVLSIGSLHVKVRVIRR